MPYARIDSVTFDSLVAAEGSLVRAVVVVSNPLLPGSVAVTGSYDGQEIALVEPIYEYLETGQTVDFHLAFYMPNHDVNVTFDSWSWYEDYTPDGYPTGIWSWHQQESWGPVRISLAAPVPAPKISTLEVKYYKKMATLSLPWAALAGSIVKGTLEINNYESDAQFAFGGYWRSLLLGAAGGQGSILFVPPAATVKQGGIFYSEVSFTMPDQGVNVWAFIWRFEPSLGVYKPFEQEGPLVVQRL